MNAPSKPTPAPAHTYTLEREAGDVVLWKRDDGKGLAARATNWRNARRAFARLIEEREPEPEPVRAEPPPVSQAVRPCPDCGAANGQLHADGCDVERCPHCGDQRLTCGARVKQAARIPWDGSWPGTKDCERFGFWSLRGRPVPAGTPGAVHDLNRLYTDTRWDRKTGKRELR